MANLWKTFVVLLFGITAVLVSGSLKFYYEGCFYYPRTSPKNYRTVSECNTDCQNSRYFAFSITTCYCLTTLPTFRSVNCDYLCFDIGAICGGSDGSVSVYNVRVLTTPPPATTIQKETTSDTMVTQDMTMMSEEDSATTTTMQTLINTASDGVINDDGKQPTLYIIIGSSAAAVFLIVTSVICCIVSRGRLSRRKKRKTKPANTSNNLNPHENMVLGRDNLNVENLTSDATLKTTSSSTSKNTDKNVKFEDPNYHLGGNNMGGACVMDDSDYSHIPSR